MTFRNGVLPTYIIGHDEIDTNHSYSLLANMRATELGSTSNLLVALDLIFVTFFLSLVYEIVIR